jgi:response regulator of citrate/malate metabolism
MEARPRVGRENEMLMHVKHGPVVLVTRDQEFAKMVAGALGTLGPQAPRLSSVNTMGECAAAVQLLHPSVVLLDDVAVERPGPQLLEELQAVQSDVRVVYIASRHSLELERDMRRQGVFFYVARPFESETLEGTLVNILRGLLRATG